MTLNSIRFLDKYYNRSAKFYFSWHYFTPLCLSSPSTSTSSKNHELPLTVHSHDAPSWGSNIWSSQQGTDDHWVWRLIMLEAISPIRACLKNSIPYGVSGKCLGKRYCHTHHWEQFTEITLYRLNFPTSLKNTSGLFHTQEKAVKETMTTSPNKI